MDESVRKLYIIRNELQNMEQTGANTSAFKSSNMSTNRNKFRNYYEMDGVFYVLTCLKEASNSPILEMTRIMKARQDTHMRSSDPSNYLPLMVGEVGSYPQNRNRISSKIFLPTLIRQ